MLTHTHLPMSMQIRNAYNIPKLVMVGAIIHDVEACQQNLYDIETHAEISAYLERMFNTYPDELLYSLSYSLESSAAV
jgi:hypothetical protein